MNNQSVQQALKEVQHQITVCEQRYNRQPGEVTLMAVSKKKPAQAVQLAVEAGQLHFGENYADEGIGKIQALNNPALTWHYIGAIQSRKCKPIAEHFQWAHGVDRNKTAQRLSDHRPSQMPPLNICLQAKLDDEPGKAGVTLDELHPLAEFCQSLPGITLRGIMAIPAPVNGLQAQRESLSRLKAAFDELKQQITTVDTLSMGMSADMEAAVAEGSTLVRVGTAIFGTRT